MKKSKVTRSLLATCSIVALSVVLSGCLHSGDDAPAMTPEETCKADGGTWADGECTTAEDKAAELLKQQRAAITTAIGAAQTAVAAVNNDSTDAEVSAADTAIANAESAIAAATNVPAEEKAANTGTVNALATQLNTAKMARQTAMDDADKKAKDAMNAMAKKLKAGLDGATLTFDDQDDTHGVSVSGGKLTAEGDFDADGTGSGEAAEVSAVMPGSGTVAPSIPGWNGADYVLTTKSGVTNHAVAYSNPEPSESVPITTKWGSATTGIEDIIDDTGRIPQSFLTSRASYVAGSKFASGAGSKNHTTNDDDAVSLSGTFDGASGTYTCTQNDTTKCTSAVLDGGGITLAGGWHFTPLAGAMTKSKDDDYVMFGWWAHDTGKVVAVAPFVESVGTTAVSQIGGVQGTATYSGGATGKVAIYNPLADNNMAGAFTADATLEADFGNATAGGRISGTIDNFSVEGTSVDWSVALKESDINAENGAIGGSTIETTWTIGGSAAEDSGSWSGALHELDTESSVPMTAAGTFTSTYDDAGSMVGAFGATKD